MHVVAVAFPAFVRHPATQKLQHTCYKQLQQVQLMISVCLILTAKGEGQAGKASAASAVAHIVCFQTPLKRGMLPWLTPVCMSCCAQSTVLLLAPAQSVLLVDTCVVNDAALAPVWLCLLLGSQPCML